MAFTQSADSADVLEYLIEEGAPVGVVKVGVATPLHYAVAGGHMTCVQLLLEHKADVNAMATSEQVHTQPSHTHY